MRAFPAASSATKLESTPMPRMRSVCCARITTGHVAATPPPITVVLYGDPTKPGLFVTRVKFSAGWKDAPHWHPDEARTVAVLSGTFYFGRGETWDESKFTAYPAGTFYSEPPKAPHFTWAKDGDVVIQITGIGPSGKTFVKPVN